jgi:hypothetical protein
MGIDSYLAIARKLFSSARRGVMISPHYLTEFSTIQIRNLLNMIVDKCGPCDVILADIDINVSDDVIKYFIDLCEEIEEKKGKSPESGWIPGNDHHNSFT